MSPALLIPIAGALLVLGALPTGVVEDEAAQGPKLESDAVPFRARSDSGVLTLRAPGPTRVRIPASTFVMGSTPEQILASLVECGLEPFGHRCEDGMFSDEAPLRRVFLSGYWMDRTEVTVAEYQRCVAARRCEPPPFEYGGRRFDHPTYPVSLVRWDDANDYCRFRGARLPTEAEFERAARGVSGRRYPWGNLFNSRAANHGAFSFSPTDGRDGFIETAPVGSFPAGRTKEGIEDLAGNVAEWVFDRYLPRYLPEDVRDPRGPEAQVAGGIRVVRGGGYQSAAPWLRGAARDGAEPHTRRPFIGFRCARGDRRPSKAPLSQ